MCRLESGESGQLTCHAPVTSRSVELDFLVGTENPIRLLLEKCAANAGWGPRQQTRCPLLSERVLSAFLAILGAMRRNRGRFYLWQDRGLDYRWTGGRGHAVNYPLGGGDWFARRPTWSCGGSRGEPVEEQGLTAVILSCWVCYWGEMCMQILLNNNMLLRQTRTRWWNG